MWVFQNHKSSSLPIIFLCHRNGKRFPAFPARRSGRSYHYSLAIKFEHFEVECVPDALEVRMPSLFSNQHRHQIGVVVLFDHRGNEFEVAMTKRGLDVFLAQGWRQVGRCVGLHDGGWFKMVYVGCNRIFIEARDRLYNPPFCPASPRIYNLNSEPRVVTNSDNAVPSIDPSVYVGRKPTVVMSYYGTLTRADVITTFLHLPCDFCTCVLPNGEAEITVVGEDARPWTCNLVFPITPGATDVIVRGWGVIVDAYDLEEGYAFRLDVPVESTSIMFLGSH